MCWLGLCCCTVRQSPAVPKVQAKRGFPAGEPWGGMFGSDLLEVPLYPMPYDPGLMSTVTLQASCSLHSLVCLPRHPSLTLLVHRAKTLAGDPVVGLGDKAWYPQACLGSLGLLREPQPHS